MGDPGGGDSEGRESGKGEASLHVPCVGWWGGRGTAWSRRGRSLCCVACAQNEYAALFVALIGEGPNPQVRLLRVRAYGHQQRGGWEAAFGPPLPTARPGAPQALTEPSCRSALGCGLPWARGAWCSSVPASGALHSRHAARAVPCRAVLCLAQGVVQTNEGRVVRAFHRFTLVNQAGERACQEPGGRWADSRHACRLSGRALTRCMGGVCWRAGKAADVTKGRTREASAVKISCARADPNARNCHGYRKFVKRTVLEDPSKVRVGRRLRYGGEGGWEGWLVCGAQRTRAGGPVQGARGGVNSPSLT